MIRNNMARAVKKMKNESVGGLDAMGKVSEGVEKAIGTVCFLEGAKTCCNVLHWNAGSLSEHKLCDEVKTELDSFEDTVAEVTQTVMGERIKSSDVVPEKVDADSLLVLLDAVAEDAFALRKALERDVAFAGLLSDVDAFLTKVQRLHYQATFCVKE